MSRRNLTFSAPPEAAEQFGKAVKRLRMTKIDVGGSLLAWFSALPIEAQQSILGIASLPAAREEGFRRILEHEGVPVHG